MILGCNINVNLNLKKKKKLKNGDTLSFLNFHTILL